MRSSISPRFIIIFIAASLIWLSLFASFSPQSASRTSVVQDSWLQRFSGMVKRDPHKGGGIQGGKMQSAAILDIRKMNQSLPFAKMPALGSERSAVDQIWSHLLKKVSAFPADVAADTVVTPTPTPSPAIILAPPVDYNVGGESKALASADLNNDGRADLVAGVTGFGVAVLLNNGDGTFAQPPATYTGGSPERGVIATDLNGDGRPDLAISGGGGMGVMLNRGDGTFGGPVFYQTGTGLFPVSVTSGDFYGDNRTHLALVEVGFFGCCSTLTIFRNQGNGTFTKALQFSLHDGGVFATAVDVNNDSYPDLITANGNTLGPGSISVFVNNRNGNFAPSADYATADVRRITAADVDGDGQADLVLSNSAGTSVSVLPNQGNGVFGQPVSYFTGYFAADVAVSDLDGDGHQDLAAYVLGTVAVLRNNGDGTFALPVNFSAAQNQTGNSDPIIAVDLDGDGDADVVTGDNAQSSPATSIHVLTNQRLQPIGIGELTVFPDHGGNTGSVTVTISFAGLQAGTGVKLVVAGEPDIVGINPIFVAGTVTNRLTVTFDLRGASLGIREIVLMQPNGTDTTLPKTFTIEQGRASDVWVDVIGWAKIRGGRPQTYYIVYGNRGNVDATSVRFWITFPTFLTWSLNVGQVPSALGQVGEHSFIAFDVSAIPAGSTGTIPLRLRAPDTPDFAHRMFQIQAWKDDHPSHSTLEMNHWRFPATTTPTIMEDKISASNIGSYFFESLRVSTISEVQSVTCSYDLTPTDGDVACKADLEGGTTSEGRIRCELAAMNIRVNHCPCSAVPTGQPCTHVEGFQQQPTTTTRLEAFHTEFGNPLVITGGTEPGFGHSMRHLLGFKVDFGQRSNPFYGLLSSFITSDDRYAPIGNRAGDDSEQYLRLSSPASTFSGAVFALENFGDPHWDIDFGSDLTRTLTLHVEGNGRVVSRPQGLDCHQPMCSQEFLRTGIDTKPIILTAFADQDSRFAGWGGDASGLNPSIEGPIAFDKTIIANFVGRPDPPPDPPGGSNCWHWDPTLNANRGGWTWSSSCTGNPPSDVFPPPVPELCWFKLFDAADQFVGFVLGECGGDCNDPQVNGNSVLAVSSSIPLTDQGSGVSNDCNPSILDGEIVTSNDPNDKVGSQGSGLQQYISGATPLRYSVFFSNKETASAPAQDVVIADQLDLTNDDLGTFSFGPIAFGDKLVTPSPHTNTFTEVVDLRPANNLLVRVDGLMNASTGLLTWRFTSLDPLTGQPPEDPLAGFLPPGGEGSVFFTVMPQQDLATDTEIQNQAAIVFDLNPPLNTQNWVNKLDNNSPSSHVLPLPANENSNSFVVEWTGSDAGSGIQDFTVYVSDDGGPFTAFQTNTTTLSATFSGQGGHTYSFYSVTRDNVGNVEVAPLSPDAVTAIPYSAPTSTGSPVTIQLGNITITFAVVTVAGVTSASPIDPNTQGAPPSGEIIIGPAYDLATTAGHTGPVQVCFNLPSITEPTVFSHLKALHTENGALVDRTTGQDFASRTLCASVNTLAPFVIAQGAVPTAAPATISGIVTTADGRALAGVTIGLSGQTSVTTITDGDGKYHFDNVETNNFYTVTPSLVNYHFSPTNRSFSLLANKTDAVFTATPDGAVGANAIDTTEFFVRQHYLDFLSREPDQRGLDYWSHQINQCNGDAACIRARRIDVSAAFFVEQEFQKTGSFIYGLYKGALGRPPLYREFSADHRQLIGSADVGEARTTLTKSLVQRPEFVTKFESARTADAFVDAVLDIVLQTSGVDLSGQRSALISKYNVGASVIESRSAVVEAVGETAAFRQAEYNAAFVLTQYFGYLRRDPDPGGYLFWLDVLNNRDANNYRGMVCAFITSREYQQRFSPVVTRTDAECGR